MLEVGKFYTVLDETRLLLRFNRYNTNLRLFWLLPDGNIYSYSYDVKEKFEVFKELK